MRDYVNGVLVDVPPEVIAEREAEALRIKTPTVDDFRRAVEAHVEATARARHYGSAVSCASYVGSTNATWAAEAAAFVAWRDDVWETVFAALAAWQAGGVAPTVEGLVASLPVIEWPS